MNAFHFLPGCRVDCVNQIDPSSLQLEAYGVREGARCPDCRVWSEAGHGSYQRRPADLPLLGRAVQIFLRVRRFRCHNAACARRTFAERLPGLLAPYARRTHRLAAAQGAVAVALGGAAGARLFPRLAMPASADTLLRLVRALPLPTPPTPTALGVDDWAFKRGSVYGTILVDLDTRRAVDLLPDRKADTLAAWLHPRRRKIKAVARDRSTEFARGVNLGAPRARQVADRWHLLQNTREMLTRWLFGVHGRLRRLPANAGAACPSTRKGVRTRAFPRARTALAASAASRARWRAHYQEVRRRHAAGESLRAIKKVMGLSRGVVRRFARAESFPERAMRAPGPSMLDPFVPWLEERLAAGCENASALHRGMRERGYPGGSRQVHRWVHTQRSAPAKTTPPRRRDLPPVPGQSDTPALASPRQLAWLLLQPAAKLDAEQKATVAQIEQDKEVKTAGALSRRFAAMVQASGVTRRRAPSARLAAFARWMSRAKTGGVQAVETFATGLQQDIGSIKAALTTRWSNGQTEGQVNKLKLLKRQMYGRAKFDLLRRRLLLAS
jgi:transposase